MKKNLTEMVFILDKSGSMAGMKAEGLDVSWMEESLSQIEAEYSEERIIIQ